MCKSDNALQYAQNMLSGEFTADRCRHPSVTETTLWIFRNGKQVGVIAEIPVHCSCGHAATAEAWRANRMFAGMPHSEKRYDSLAQAVQHITSQNWV